MRRGRDAAPATTAALTALLALAPVAAHATAPSAADVSVTALHVAGDYPRSHTVYAIGERNGCTGDCIELLRSRDGGGTWARAAAAGWQHGDVMPLSIGGRAALVTAVDGGMAISLDGGDSFQPSVAAGTPVAVAPVGDQADVVLSGKGGASDEVVRLPSRAVRAIPHSATMTQLTITPSPAYPDPPQGVPAALALGIDSATGSARLARCDASLACSATTPVASGGELVFSPHFARDLTVFFLTPKGLLRSHDAGRTLVPTTVIPPTPATLVTTVTALALTPDFDAVAKRGTVFAAVVSAGSAAKGGGTLSGGVYRSLDAGATWSPAANGGVLDHGASAVALAPDGRLFAGTLQLGSGSSGVYCSADGGAWAPSCPAYATGDVVSSVAGGGGSSGVHRGAGSDPPMPGAGPARADAAVGRTPSGAVTAISTTSGTLGRAAPTALLVAVAVGAVAGLRRRQQRRKGGDAIDSSMS